MNTLREYLQEAKKSRHAIGHFNVSENAALKAIAAVAGEKNTPLIIGTSEGERDFFGVREIAAIVRILREERGIPVFLNADHTKSFEKVKEAVEAGYDAILFDAGSLALDENIRKTKEAAEWIRAYNKEHGTDILVEGELGYIGTSSILLDEIPQGAAVTEAQLTTAEDLKKFIKETGVDMVAPAVGNIHGMLKNMPNPHLHMERIQELCSAAAGIPVVLHGGSGISDEQFSLAIAAGVAVVHINTELRIAWKKGFELSFISHPHEIVPYKIIPDVIEEMQRVIENKVRVFTF